jgi:GTP-binding protein Era
MPIERAGSIALIGRPNAGKSTLLNQVIGEKVSITASKPQTTRNRVVGIFTRADAQVVMVDTPGIHIAKSRMNKAMVRAAETSLADVDAVCWVVDGIKAIDRLEKRRPVVHGGDKHIAALIAASGVPATVALNKVDKVSKRKLLPVMAAYGQAMPGIDLVPISALKGTGVDTLVDIWAGQLPEGSAIFPEDQIMDGSERFLVSELIREKVFRLTMQEVPYSTAVDIEKFDETQREGEAPRVHIYARILVERDSQKGILIGKGGAMLKQIGTMARKDMQRLLGAHVFLELHVTVQNKWTTNPRLLGELGLE